MGHIINLTVQAFLFGNDKDNIIPTDDLGELEASKWRTKGALGKLHNIVVYVQRSPQRTAQFMELSQGKMMERDNATRWNSWARMIGCALRIPVAIRMFCEDHRDDLQDDLLDTDDWSHIKGVYQVLSVLEQTTLDVEGALGTLGKVIVVMDFLLGLFEKIRQDETERYSYAVKVMSNNAWNKLTKYYNLTETSTAYIGAVVLDPRVKWVYFTTAWPAKWLEKAKNDMEKHWEQFYTPHTAVGSILPQSVHIDGQSEISKFRAQHIPQDDEEMDEYKLYCISPRLPGKSTQLAVDWWREESQQEAYPNLSRLAIDMLSIPAMSDEPERLFSRAKQTLNNERAQLAPDTVEALECIKSWSHQRVGGPYTVQASIREDREDSKEFSD